MPIIAEVRDEAWEAGQARACGATGQTCSLEISRFSCFVLNQSILCSCAKLTAILYFFGGKIHSLRFLARIR